MELLSVVYPLNKLFFMVPKCQFPFGKSPIISFLIDIFFISVIKAVLSPFLLFSPFLLLKKNPLFNLYLEARPWGIANIDNGLVKTYATRTQETSVVSFFLFWYRCISFDPVPLFFPFVNLESLTIISIKHLFVILIK